MTQHEQVVNYLKDHPEGLTTYEAFLAINQTKLTSRISEKFQGQGERWD